MSDYIFQAYSWLMSFAARADRHQWVIVLLAITFFGFMCMRGMGRRNY